MTVRYGHTRAVALVFDFDSSRVQACLFFPDRQAVHVGLVNEL